MLCKAGDGGDASPPKDLMQTLSRKGLLVRVCRSVFNAMSELVLHEMQVRKGETRAPMILMVVEPDEIQGSRDLVRAAEKYAPHSACWRYTRRSKPKLAAFRVEKDPSKDDAARHKSGREIPVGPALAQEPPEEHGSLTGAFEAITSRTVRTAKAARPKLRLAGDGPMPETQPGAKVTEAAKDEDKGPAGFEDGPIEPEIVIGEPLPLDAKPIEGRPAPKRAKAEEPELPSDVVGTPGDAGPLLSDEELAILLWDTWYPEQQEG